ncbi:MAG TPA: 3-phosphoglycerate dehydrogenase [Bacteroidetes bacterium]|nr:3-phosphoglycerate dehydrogenase [Bacteroidota bacterium]
MTNILANDGIDKAGQLALEEAGFNVDINNIPQDELAGKLSNYEVLLVRSATKVRKDLIDSCPNLKMIGRGGVGMDNIDVEYARSKGITVVNTPAASSLSVAELVYAHLFGGYRFLYDSNREMPGNGNSDFKQLKKKYAKGQELQGKTMGIIGFGRIGRETGKIALGLGMKLLAHDPFMNECSLTLNIDGLEAPVNVPVKMVSKEEVLENCDVLSMHVPFNAGDRPVIGEEEINMMKDGVSIINCARGGCIDESALITKLDQGKVSFAGVDVFENEPTPQENILKADRVSLTPHIGASTVEAQKRIGLELADQIINFFK